MTEHEQAVLEVFRDVLDIEVSGVDVDLIENGLLDSLGLVVLLAELEERFGVRIPLESLEVEQLRTVGLLASLVETLQRDASA
jgi:acyl carrier protein